MHLIKQKEMYVKEKTISCVKYCYLTYPLHRMWNANCLDLCSLSCLLIFIALAFNFSLSNFSSSETRGRDCAVRSKMLISLLSSGCSSGVFEQN